MDYIHCIHLPWSAIYTAYIFHGVLYTCIHLPWSAIYTAYIFHGVLYTLHTSSMEYYIHSIHLPFHLNGRPGKHNHCLSIYKEKKFGLQSEYLQSDVKARIYRRPWSKVIYILRRATFMNWDHLHNF